jgi:transposase
VEQEIIKLLDVNMECINSKIKRNQVIFTIQSRKNVGICPYCRFESSRVHSNYQREIQDLPIQEKQTILLIRTRKMFCDNPNCNHKTFSETFDFVAPKAKKTKRLIDKILRTSTKLSSVSASSVLNHSAIKTCKSSICDLLKKNAIECG